ncbi:MAG: ATP-binding cassette domain-containing protein [Rickettsiales bacterium]|nr:ATP-binding cassette domain-containing protein [Rickettsiales bacterium]
MAIDSISLEIPSNTIYGIIGKSGAGKSTIVRIMSLMEKPDFGEIFYNEERVDILEGKELLQKRHEIGMIFQNFNLFSSRNVAKNIAYPLEIVGKNKDEIEKRVDELLELVDLKDKKYYSISKLSGGQKQRVAIARALANKPNILFCDEATSALDPQTTTSIIKLIKNIQSKMQLSVIMITHQMEVVRDACDYVSVIDEGKIVESGKVRNVFKHPQTKIAREFLSTLRATASEEIIEKLPTNSVKYRLSFDGQTTDKPMISRIIKDFDLDVNILSATINSVNGEYIGETIAEIIGTDDNIKKALIFLRRVGVDVNEV